MKSLVDQDTAIPLGVACYLISMDWEIIYPSSITHIMKAGYKQNKPKFFNRSIYPLRFFFKHALVQTLYHVILSHRKQHAKHQFKIKKYDVSFSIRTQWISPVQEIWDLTSKGSLIIKLSQKFGHSHNKMDLTTEVKCILSAKRPRSFFCLHYFFHSQ